MPYLPPIPQTIEEAEAYFRSLQQACSDFFLFPYGTTYSGASLPSVTVGRIRQPVLFATAFDAQESPLSKLLFRFLEDLAAGLSEEGPFAGYRLTDQLRQRGVLAAPLANPDGVEIALTGTMRYRPLRHLIETLAVSGEEWHANPVGVLLQTNFDFDYSPCEPELRSGTGFCGLRAASEPEVKAFMQLNCIFSFPRIITLHFGANDILYTHSPRVLANQTLAAAVAASTGFSLVQGSAAVRAGSPNGWYTSNFGGESYRIEIERTSVSSPEGLDAVYARLFPSFLSLATSF